MSAASLPQLEIQQIQQLLGRRRLTTIPNDQREILHADGSWALDLTERQDLLLAPAHVIENVAQRYLLRDREVATIRSPTQQQPECAALQSQGPMSEQQEGQGNTEVEGEVPQETEDYSQPSTPPPSSGEKISWSQSPPRPRSPLVERTVTTSLSTQADITTQVDEYHIDDTAPSGEHGPLQMSQRSVVVTQHVEDDQDEEETDMDMKLPEAQRQSDVGVNMESARVQVVSTPAATSLPLFNETPSCAQPHQVIPATIVTSKILEPPGKKLASHPQRKHKYKPNIFDGTTPEKPPRPETLLPRLPNKQRLSEIGSSISTSSSSLIPATCVANPTQEPTTHSPGKTEENEVKTGSPAPQGREAAVNSHKLSAIGLPLQQPPSPPVTGADMYGQFTSTYPDYVAIYSGSLKNFLKACICLEYLEKERGLRASLFDDFIRSFSAGYLPYVRNAGPGQEPLPAIEWFNMIDEQPIFNNMLITRKNLQAVLQGYAREVAGVRRFIAGEPPQQDNTIEESRGPGSEPHGGVHRRRRTSEVDEAQNTTPAVSPPGPAKHQSRKRPASPNSQRRLRSEEASELPRLVPPSSRRQRAPSASQYFQKIKSDSRSSSRRTPSADYEARLRQHFRNSKNKNAVSSTSR